MQGQNKSVHPTGSGKSQFTTMKMLNELIENVKNGDKDAFDKIVRLYEKALWGHIRGKAKQDADADDIAQETWSYVMNKIHTYNSEKAKFYTWLRIWAQIQAKRYYAKRKDLLRMSIIASDLQTLRDRGDIQEDKEIKNVFENIADEILSPSEALISRQEKKEKLNLYWLLLETAISKGGYPHQIICFLFCKTIDNWPPRRIVKELSEIPLEELCKKLKQDYLSESGLPEKRISRTCEPLLEKMGRKVRQVIPRMEAMKRFRECQDMRLGETMLSQYYSRNDLKSKTANISDWIYRVKRRILSEVLAHEKRYFLK